MTKNTYSTLVKEFAHQKKDVGSAELQIISLTYQIKELTEHMKKNKKDVHSRKGLIGKVSKRKKLLKYLQRTDTEKQVKLCKKLELKYK